MIIDFHTHIFPPEVRQQRESYLARDPGFRMLYSRPQAKIANAEDLVSSMEAEGVDVSVALNFGWADQGLCQETNSYILEAARRYRGKLIAFCAIQPTAGDRAVYEMERCAREGARGVGELRSDTQGYSLGEGRVMEPVVAAARRLGLCLLFHASEPVGHEYPGKGSVTPDKLYRFISAFPEATVICAHWGGGLPFYALMPEVATALRNTYFDTAASPLLYQTQVFKQVVEIIGAGKILFGSDYPLLPPRRILAQLRSQELSDEVSQAILGGNAQKLLGLK